MRVKICGTTGREDLEASVRAGADAVGFVAEYPDPVPWDLDREEAARLIDRVPPFVASVLVTTGDPDAVCDLARATRPDVVQLHGEEEPEAVESTVRALDRLGIRTIKAVALSQGADPDEQLASVLEFAARGVDGLVVDARADDRRGGGTGRTVPRQLARDVVAETDVPVVLAGGLTPDNVAGAVETVRPYGVDVITGVERTRGRKDPEKLAAFVAAARGAGGQ
ncbi:MAG: phosphoribosylanthranilate isomerase [Salinigranum sp.]